MSQPVAFQAMERREIASQGSLDMHGKKPTEMVSTSACRNEASQSEPERFCDFGDSVLLTHGVLTPDLCNEIVQSLEQWSWVPADLQGRARVLDDGQVETSSGVASHCISTYDKDVANLLWEKLEPIIPPEQEATGNVFHPVGIDPLLRFVRFDSVSGPQLTVPHYDAGHDFEEGNLRTLKSVVLALTWHIPGEIREGKGLRTRFLLDTQRWMPVDERSFLDHAKPASQKDVLAEIPMNIADCLLFDHRTLHDFVVWTDPSSPQIVLRTDIIYEQQQPAPAMILTTSDANTVSVSETTASLDPTYRKALAALNGSFEAIRNAGYFDDGLPGNYHSFDRSWWTGPVDKVQSRLSQLGRSDGSSKELAVLATTGAFCPIHQGHIQMMETAKRELELRGVAVLGGYFCPDHEQYVSSKMRSGGESDVLSSAQRLSLCELAVAGSEWLAVDRWAAHIRTHRPVHVVYVFGGDNARFSFAFARRHSCVCVLRPGSRASFEEVSEYVSLLKSPRVIFSWDSSPAFNSTGVRRGDTSGLSDGVAEQWTRFQSARTGLLALDNSRPVNFYMREEGHWAVAPWASDPSCTLDEISRLYGIFCTGLKRAFARAFAREPRMLPRVNIVPLRLQDQQQTYQKLFGNVRVISLDPCLPGTINVQVSRCFRPLNSRACKFIARHGAPPLTTQIGSIEPGNYTLFDDDTFSGMTGKYITALLADRCTVDRFQTLCDEHGPLTLDDQAAAIPLGKRLNHVDCRDFLVGSREGGLCLELSDGSICRAPYLLPYVSPHDRASVPVDAELDFSKEVWKLNKDFFSSLGVDLCLADMSPAFQELGASLGFANIRMEDLCAWNLRHLC